MKSLDLSALNSKKLVIVSTTEALKDVTPINWSTSVASGDEKIVIACKK